MSSTLDFTLDIVLSHKLSVYLDPADPRVGGGPTASLLRLICYNLRYTHIQYFIRCCVVHTFVRARHVDFVVTNS